MDPPDIAQFFLGRGNWLIPIVKAFRSRLLIAVGGVFLSASRVNLEGSGETVEVVLADCNEFDATGRKVPAAKKWQP